MRLDMGCARLVTTLGATLVLLAPAAAQETESGGAKAPSSAEYRIGIADELRITVWREPDLSLPVIVRPDGSITVPLVGDVRALGRTATEITREITSALTKYIKEPIVTVIVEQINSNTIYVIGEVNRQGSIELRQRTRFLQALAMAGGLTEFADKSRVVLLREEGGREVVREIDYRRLIRGEAPGDNLYVQPGDTIIVY
jgi:polysaccharide export outer membrane protein